MAKSTWACDVYSKIPSIPVPLGSLVFVAYNQKASTFTLPIIGDLYGGDRSQNGIVSILAVIWCGTLLGHYMAPGHALRVMSAKGEVRCARLGAIMPPG